MLALVWVGAAAGITLRQVWLDAPQWVVAIPYVVVGWCPVVVAPAVGAPPRLGRLRPDDRWRAAPTRPARCVYAAQAARPVAAGLRLPRGVPRVHARRGALFAYLIAFIALPAY